MMSSEKANAEPASFNCLKKEDFSSIESFMVFRDRDIQEWKRKCCLWKTKLFFQLFQQDEAVHNIHLGIC